MNAGQIAHQNRQPLVAVQRQQRPLAHDGQLGRESLDLQHSIAGAAQLIAAYPLHALIDADEQIGAGVGFEAEGVGFA